MSQWDSEGVLFISQGLIMRSFPRSLTEHLGTAPAEDSEYQLFLWGLFI